MFIDSFCDYTEQVLNNSIQTTSEITNLAGRILGNLPIAQLVSAVANGRISRISDIYDIFENQLVLLFWGRRAINWLA